MLKVTESKYIDSFICIGLLSLVTILGGILASTTVSADSVVDQVRVIVPTSCTIVGTGQTSHNAEIVNGLYQSNIGSTTIKAYCNDSDGFAIYATGYTGNTIGETNSNKLVGQNTNQTIITGTATTSGNPDVSNWAMKLSTVSNPTPTYPITIDNGFSSYSQVPNTYTKVAHRDSATDVGTNAEGTNLTTTYAAYISKTQPADTYSGQVIYTLVHPVTETPAQPIACASGYICYYPNTNIVEGTMGRQSISASDTSATLVASNFSKTGYGFAGWSDAYDYTTNANAHFYGPNEYISFTAGQYTGSNPGLSLYAVWVKSAGSFQDAEKVATLCGTGTSSLIAATYNDEGDTDEFTWSITAGLSSVSALTDTRDNQTYAIAKLTDGNCWMIENLRLDNTAELTTLNTNNPLNDGDATNSTVTLKHNYTDAVTYNTLSATSSVSTATSPDGWCDSQSASCIDQSRLRTNNTASRVTYTAEQTMSTDVNLYSYGNYYNWYSATAGNGTYNETSSKTAGDLCPFGWHLPTGTGSGEFSLLSNSLGGYKNASNVAQQMTSSTTPTGSIMDQRIRHFPNNFVRSGYALSTRISDRGSEINYWSSTPTGNKHAWILYYWGTTFAPGVFGVYKYTGMTVRCLTSSGF